MECHLLSLSAEATHLFQMGRFPRGSTMQWVPSWTQNPQKEVVSVLTKQHRMCFVSQALSFPCLEPTMPSISRTGKTEVLTVISKVSMTHPASPKLFYSFPVHSAPWALLILNLAETPPSSGPSHLLFPRLERPSPQDLLGFLPHILRASAHCHCYIS